MAKLPFRVSFRAAFLFLSWRISNFHAKTKGGWKPSCDKFPPSETYEDKGEQLRHKDHRKRQGISACVVREMIYQKHMNVINYFVRARAQKQQSVGILSLACQIRLANYCFIVMWRQMTRERRNRKSPERAALLIKVVIIDSLKWHQRWRLSKIWNVISGKLQSRQGYSPHQSLGSCSMTSMIFTSTPFHGMAVWHSALKMFFAETFWSLSRTSRRVCSQESSFSLVP